MLSRRYSTANLSSYVILALLITLYPGATYAERENVCPSGCDYSSISDGINAAHSGDIVEVHSGTYVENVVVKKPIILQGIDTGTGRPIIDANHNESGVTLAAEGIVLKGFEIEHAQGSYFDLWAGINVVSNGSIIADNVVDGNENGILIEGISNCTLKDNRAINNRYGIKLVKSSNNLVDSNTVINNASCLFSNTHGILLTYSNRNNIFNNNIAENSFGFMLNDSRDNKLKNNRIYANRCNFGAGLENDIDESNFVDNKSIFILKNASDRLIESSSNAGIVLCFDCRNITLRGLTLKNNLYGIYLCNTTQSTIENNILSNNSFGLKMDSSKGNEITLNEASNNFINGIYIRFSENNSVKSNVIKENSNSGLFIINSMNNNLSNNYVIGNSNGFELSRSFRNIIANNNMSANSNCGILALKSSYNTIFQNDLKRNHIGLSLLTSWNNSVEKNLIRNNLKALQIMRSEDNAISNNTISSNDIVLSRDLSGYNISQNSISNNKKSEELIPPAPTKSPTGIYIPHQVVVEIQSVPADAKITLNDEIIGKTNLTTMKYEGDYDLELIWENESYQENFNIYKDTKIFVNRQEIESRQHWEENA